MPIVNVIGVGNVSLPDGMSQADMEAAIQQIPHPDNFQPAPQLPDKMSPLNQSLFEMAGMEAPGSGQERLAAIGHELLNQYQGAKQLGLMLGEKAGIVPQGTAQNYTNDVNEENNFFEKTPAAQRSGARLIGKLAPYLAMPAIGAESAAGQIAGNALVNGAIGALQYTPEADFTNKGINAGIGAAIGGGISGLGQAAGNGISYLASKLTNAKNGVFADPSAAALIASGEQHNVPLYASDVSTNPIINGVTQKLDEIPVLGMRGSRIAQNQAAQAAANNVASDLQNTMLNLPFGGKLGLKDLQQVIDTGAPRAEAAQKLMNQIQNSGDDWQKIIESSGNLNLFRKKLIADAKYNKVANIADQFGTVPINNTINAVDNMISVAQNAVLKNEPLINKLNKIRDGLVQDIPSQITGSSINASGLDASNILSGIKPKSLTYSQLQGLRSDLGDEISDYFTGKNAAIGKKGVGLLMSVKNQLENDMNNFAQANGPQLKTAFQNANNFYKTAVAPYKDKQLAQSLTNGAPDEIYNKFITRSGVEGGPGTTRAQRFYNALDEKGRAAVRYGMVNNAFDTAVNKENNIFNVPTFVNNLENQAAGKGVFFKGQDKAEMDGFINLMKHVKQSSTALANPKNGQRVLPYLIGAAGSTGLFAAPAATTGAAAGVYGLTKLMTTKAGRNFLLASSKLTPGSQAMQSAINRVGNKLGLAATLGATQSTSNGGQ